MSQKLLEHKIVPKKVTKITADDPISMKLFDFSSLGKSSSIRFLNPFLGSGKRPYFRTHFLSGRFEVKNKSINGTFCPVCASENNKNAK